MSNFVRIQTDKFRFVDLGSGYRDVSYDPASQVFNIDTPDYELRFVNVPSDVGARVYKVLLEATGNVIVTELYKFGVLSEEV